MREETKLYILLLLSLVITSFFIGYAIGYQSGESFAYEWIDYINEK